MTPPPELNILAERATPDWDSQSVAPSRVGGLAPLIRDRRWLFASFGWALLHISHPMAWHGLKVELWDPGTGLGLVLLAWLGPRALAVIALAWLTSAIQAYWRGINLPGDGAWDMALVVAPQAVLGVVKVQAAWWCYRRIGAGSVGLSDFRSAVAFVTSVVVVFGLAAIPSTAGVLAMTVRSDTFWLVVLNSWLADAIGALTVAPVLLILSSHWMLWPTRWQKSSDDAGDSYRNVGTRASRRWTQREWIEWSAICGLSALLGLIGFGLLTIQGESLNWQWLQLPWLVVGWAGLCHGSQKGFLVAAATTIPSLVLLPAQIPGIETELALQALLLTPCGVVLLAGAIAARMPRQETPYRDVVSRLPVVLYNARVTADVEEGRPPSAEVFLVSPACKEVLGQFAEDLLGDYYFWLRHIHPEDREVVLAALAQLGRQHQPVVCEYRLAPTITVQPGPVPVLITAWSRLLASAGPRITSLQQTQPSGRWLRDTLVPQLDRLGRLIGWQGVITDITEQRHLADDLRQTTGMFHALVANLPAGVFFVQAPSGRPILVNARARQLLGKREDPAAGLDHLVETYRLHRPDGSPFPADELPVATALRRGAPTMRDDIVVHRPDGRRLPLITWAAPIDLTGKGEPDAAVWVFEDLTALHQAENARRESEAYLRTVVGTMAEALVVQDHTGKVVECNPSAGTLFGLDVDHLRGRSLLAPEWSYLREDGEPLALDDHPVRVVLATGLAVRNVVMAVKLPPPTKSDAPPLVTTTPSGHTINALRWLLVNAMPLPPGSEDQPAGVVTTFTDITGYRYAQEVLRISEEKYRGLVETLPLMLCQTDTEGRFTYVNPAVKAVTGYDLEDLREPEFWQKLIHPEDRPRTLAVHGETISRQTVRHEFRYRAKDGTERIAYSISQPQWQDDEVVGTISLIVDMTRERRLEQDLQRAQRLELIGRLSSGIAHDFNNLLTVILTLTELAKSSLPAEHATQDDLQRIAAASQQAANLAHQLLGFSKQKRMTPLPVDLNRVARRTLDLLRATWSPSIIIETSLATDLPALEGDEWQLQQVLMNLCLNAGDAMPDGGRLRVRTQARLQPDDIGGVTLGEMRAASNVPDAAWLLLSVQDSGTGMSEEVQARIFDPFFTTKELGSGLGLAVVQRIVATHGGRIDVESKPGNGTRFDVWLPRKHVECVEAKTSTES